MTYSINVSQLIYDLFHKCDYVYVVLSLFIASALPLFSKKCVFVLSI